MHWGNSVNSRRNARVSRRCLPRVTTGIRNYASGRNGSRTVGNGPCSRVPERCRAVARRIEPDIPLQPVEGQCCNVPLARALRSPGRGGGAAAGGMCDVADPRDAEGRARGGRTHMIPMPELPKSTRKGKAGKEIRTNATLDRGVGWKYEDGFTWGWCARCCEWKRAMELRWRNDRNLFGQEVQGSWECRECHPKAGKYDVIGLKPR